MTSDSRIEQAARAAAEEILRIIYGDDLPGERLDTIKGLTTKVIAAIQAQKTQEPSISGESNDPVST